MHYLLKITDENGRLILTGEMMTKFSEDLTYGSNINYTTHDKIVIDNININVLGNINTLSKTKTIIDIITKSLGKKTTNIIDPDIVEFADIESVNGNDCKNKIRLNFGKSNSGLISLVKALKGNTTITSLFANTENYSGSSACIIIESVKDKINITNIDLQFNKIGNVGIIALANAFDCNTNLTNINLNHSTINNAGVSALSKLFKNNTNITKIWLDFCNICNEGIITLTKALEGNTNIDTLSLMCNDINDDGVTVIAKLLSKDNTTIRELNLGCNNISDLGATSLADAFALNKTLTILELDDNKINCEGAMSIARLIKLNKTLTKINLHDNNIGNLGGVRIANALENNTTIKMINLELNKIGDPTAFAFARLIKLNKTLINIELSYNDQISYEGLNIILDSLKENFSITTIICEKLKFLPYVQRNQKIQKNILDNIVKYLKCETDALSPLTYNIYKYYGTNFYENSVKEKEPELHIKLQKNIINRPDNNTSDDPNVLEHFIDNKYTWNIGRAIGLFSKETDSEYAKLFTGSISTIITEYFVGDITDKLFIDQYDIFGVSSDLTNDIS